MVNFDTLLAFVKVSESLSVTQAARSLGLAKGVISSRIGQLETHLESTLFSRSTRKIALTPVGEVYLVRAKKILAEMNSAQEEVLAMRSELSGRIRLTAPVSWGQRVLTHCLPDFLLQNSKIEIELSLSDRLIDMAVEGYDIALRWSADDQLVSKNDQIISRINWLLAAAPDFIESSSNAIASPARLSDFPCLYYWKYGNDKVWRFRKGKKEEVVRVDSRYFVDNPEAVLEACLQGLGIALLPDYLCLTALAEGRLKRILPEWEPITRFGTNITAICPPERFLLPRNAALMQHLADRCPKVIGRSST